MVPSVGSLDCELGGDTTGGSDKFSHMKASSHGR